MKKKFRFEAASDTEAAFIFCEYNPVMKAKILHFRSHKEMDIYKPAGVTVILRKQLPILLELVETEEAEESLIQSNLNRMAEWYYYSYLK